ncbi:uncharacterized protein LOC135074089 [Ostrinia nubilalis]|uniref:uncharacterized protein LOC135074089 n=1 Tax=Ostrinia nubilalis TaxID=29057 RepID=UPI00308244F7
MLIGDETASKIAEVVSGALREALDPSNADQEDGIDLEHAASIAAHLATTVASKASDENYLQLTLNLFTLNVAVPRGSPRLSVESWLEVRGAAHDGLAALPREARVAARARAANELHTALLALKDTVSITQIEHMTSLCPFLLSECDDSEPPTDVSEIVEFTKQVLALPQTMSAVPTETFALRYDCIANRLNCPFEDDNDLIKAIVKEASDSNPTELTITDLVPYLNKFLFRAIFLRTMLLHRGSHEEEEDEDEEPKQNEAWCNNLMSDEYIQEEFCNLLRDFMVVTSLHEGYGYWVHHTLIQETKSKMDAIFDAIIPETSEDLRASILTRLSERAAAEGYYWSYARRFYETKVAKDGEGDEKGDPAGVTKLAEDLDVTKIETMLTGNGFFHSLQANTKWSSDSLARAQCAFAVMLRATMAAHGSRAGADEFARAALSACTDCNLDAVIDFYHRNSETMLIERDISTMSWGEVVCESSIVECVIAALSRDGWTAPPHHWDFATVTLCTLVECVHMAQKHYGCTKVAMLSLATFRLYSFVEQFIGNIKAECERRQPLPHVFELLAEWRDVFAPALNTQLYTIAAHLLQNASKTITSGQARLLSAVSRGIQRADWALAEAAHRAHSLALPRLAGVASAALARPLHPAYHCLAYRLLVAIVKPMAQHDADQLAIWSAEGTEEGEDRERPQLAPQWLHKPFARALELADAALTGHTAGVDSCEMVAGSDAHALALGCALLADALHELTTRARGDLTHHYIQHYRW